MIFPQFTFTTLIILTTAAVLSACGGSSNNGSTSQVDMSSSTSSSSHISSSTSSSSSISSSSANSSVSSSTSSSASFPVVTASDYQEPNNAENVIDGDTETRWSADGTSGVWLQFDLGTEAQINTLVIQFLKATERQSCFNIQTSNDAVNWTTQRANLVSNLAAGEQHFSFSEVTARYVRYEGKGNSESTWNSITELDVVLLALDGSEDLADGVIEACAELTSTTAMVVGEKSSGTGAVFNPGGADGTQTPNVNFFLDTWKITYPDASEANPPVVVADEFYTDPSSGAMVFQCPNQGGTTANTSYSRSELREMLNSTAGSKDLSNNWVISTASLDDQTSAGAIDGNMKATVTVDQVSVTADAGLEYMLGRVIVGQIHASDDEPFKIYYRKLPGHTKGFVYFAYEDSKEEQFFPMIGDTEFNQYGATSTVEPADGIELGEKWAYEVNITGREMTVTVITADGSYVSQVITWASEYNSDWFYFKAGAYNQNRGGGIDEFTKVSFYAFDVTHN